MERPGGQTGGGDAGCRSVPGWTAGKGAAGCLPGEGAMLTDGYAFAHGHHPRAARERAVSSPTSIHVLPSGGISDP